MVSRTCPRGEPRRVRAARLLRALDAHRGARELRVLVAHRQERVARGLERAQQRFEALGAPYSRTDSRKTGDARWLWEEEYGFEMMLS